ncbi:alpha/beta hydrolase family protein [Homoserinimonas aerilata]|uniref:Alpha/beta hydrolase family protein n=1 Tax=Homoserinimonas aerilata TaxID=1162970 RepID=A0A542YKX3_9MICO|nr:alpha/beta hydrolase [Homoserinimonas aerilata]TQL48735.1 alpha/beta hydrolase family protein [Homoserinimonas aerilata]
MRRRVVAAVGVLAAAVLLLSGCFFAGAQATHDSTPTGEDVPEQIAEFYHQVLVWSPCGDLECATASAPLDWSDPGRDTIELALIRSTAGGEAKGSLLVNPGGPGGSGVDFVRSSLEYATSDRLRGEYDIVGFDPRGVGESSAVDCYDDPQELSDYIYELPVNKRGSDGWLDEMTKSTADFGQACLQHTGELLGFVDTESAARDLDMLRAALGDEKLNYLGYSYGTFLGATYAELFPGRTGHLVLDGAIDPATSEFEVTATQAAGFESAMRAYLADCLSGSDCPFRGTVDEAMASVATLFGRLDASPLRAADGRLLGSSTMFTAIIYPLYSASSWPYLTQLLDEVLSGRAETAFQLADGYNGRNADGSYLDNSTEAFTAINCLDYPVTSTRESLQSEAEELARLAPVFGPMMSYGGTACAAWPFESTRVREQITASGSAPILVVGTTNDPATPYSWAVSLAEQLENGHLVSYEGEGHTAYNKSNSCVNDAVDGFFIDDVVPASDPRC